jgi:P27 family predicted phage terminase small subunit
MVPRGVTNAAAGPGLATIPRRPPNLGDRGRREWAKIWAAGAAWLNGEQDYHWVEQIARAYDDIAVFRRRIKADGIVQRGSQHQPVAHPLMAEIRHLEDRIDKNLSELGFSPAARARLGLATVTTVSKLDDLAAKRAARAALRVPPAAAGVPVAEVVPEDEW